MDKTDDIVGALRKVPAKRLLIINIANSITFNGDVPDPVALAEMQPALQMAKAEVQAYVFHVDAAVKALVNLSTARGA